MFDPELSFVPRVEGLRTECLVALDVLKVLSDARLGGGWPALLRLCGSLVGSRLDCGSVVCGYTCGSCLRGLGLGAVRRWGLRVCLGAFRFPVGGLCVEADGPPLHLRRTG